MPKRLIPCQICGQALSNDEIALCIKLFGLSAPRLCCLGCTARLISSDIESLKSLILYYRESGCVHFHRDYLS